MFRVLAKETMVTIGSRVFHPAVATWFQDELPPEVAERRDLLHIEEIPADGPNQPPQGLVATGTVEADPEPADESVADPTLLSDVALQEGVTVLSEEEGPAPDPFADPAPATTDPAAAELKPGNGRGRGARR